MDISDAEFEVMSALWQGHPATASELVKRLQQHKDWHEKTVKTLLGRLVKKQAVGFTREQRHYVYHPLLARQDYQRKQSSSLVSRLFDGRVAPLVAGFAKQDGLTQQDVNELKALLADWEKDNG